MDINLVLDVEVRWSNLAKAAGISDSELVVESSRIAALRERLVVRLVCGCSSPLTSSLTASIVFSLVLY